MTMREAEIERRAAMVAEGLKQLRDNAGLLVMLSAALYGLGFLIVNSYLALASSSSNLCDPAT